MALAWVEGPEVPTAFTASTS